MAAYSLKCVSFGGTDEYATMGNVLAFERTDPFSISFWMKSTNTGGGYILSKYDYTTNKGYRLFGSSGGNSVVWSISSAAGVTISRGSVSAPFACGAWSHVVLTYDGGSASPGLHIWRNAASIDNTVSGGPLAATIVTTAPFQLGAWTSSSYYTGLMDEVAVYNKVLSGAEIAWIYNGGEPRALTDSGCPSNLVAWWRMGEGDTFPTVLDSSGSGYHGTLTNMETGDIGNVYLDGTEIPYWRYSDGKYLERGGDSSGLILPTSKVFRGRPTMVCELGATGSDERRYFKMRAQDSSATPPGYVTWVVPDAPDFTGAGYSGGMPTPIGPPVSGSIVVANDWWEAL